MTTAETITEMRSLMRQRGRLLDQLSRVRNSATTTGGIGDGQPRSQSQEPKVERCSILCADLGRQIDVIDRKLALYSEDVRRPIEAIPDSVDSALLRMRYVERLPVRQIARLLCYERTAMYRVLAAAEGRWGMKSATPYNTIQQGKA